MKNISVIAYDIIYNLSNDKINLDYTDRSLMLIFYDFKLLVEDYILWIL